MFKNNYFQEVFSKVGHRSIHHRRFIFPLEINKGGSRRPWKNLFPSKYSGILEFVTYELARFEGIRRRDTGVGI